MKSIFLISNVAERAGGFRRADVAVHDLTRIMLAFCCAKWDFVFSSETAWMVTASAPGVGTDGA